MSAKGGVTAPLLIDCSTIDPNVSKSVADHAMKTPLADCAASLHSQRSPMMIDAPVSGGVAGAAAGTLTFMVCKLVPLACLRSITLSNCLELISSTSAHQIIFPPLWIMSTTSTHISHSSRVASTMCREALLHASHDTYVFCFPSSAGAEMRP